MTSMTRLHLCPSKIMSAWRLWVLLEHCDLQMSWMKILQKKSPFILKKTNMFGLAWGWVHKCSVNTFICILSISLQYSQAAQTKGQSNPSTGPRADVHSSVRVSQIWNKCETFYTRKKSKQGRALHCFPTSFGTCLRKDSGLVLWWTCSSLTQLGLWAPLTTTHIKNSNVSETLFAGMWHYVCVKVQSKINKTVFVA